MPGITVGQRVPDFKRLNSEGVTVQLYNDIHLGEPVVLWVIPKLDAPGLAETLARLETAAETWSRLSTHALLPCDPKAAAGFAAQHNLPVPALADDGSLIQFLVGAEATAPVVVLVLDRRLRLLERIDYRDANWDGSGLAERLDTEQPGTGTAPVLLIPRVFEAEFCAELIDRFNTAGGQPSGVVVHENGKQKLVPDPAVKDRSDYYFETEDDLFRAMRDRIVQRVLPEIRQYFNYPVTAHDPFRLICYDAATGGYFRPHRDNVTKDVAHRRFALTVNLNTGDYAGGELKFAEFGDQLYQPERGGAVVFSCSMVHEAMPVTRGKRYAVVSFFYNPDDKL